MGARSTVSEGMAYVSCVAQLVDCDMLQVVKGREGSCMCNWNRVHKTNGCFLQWTVHRLAEMGT